MTTRSNKTATAKPAVAPEVTPATTAAEVETTQAAVTPTEQAEVTNEPTKEPAKGSIVFHLKNGSTREFSKEVHGKDHKAIADEFHETNIEQVVTRT